MKQEIISSTILFIFTLFSTQIRAENINLKGIWSCTQSGVTGAGIEASNVYRLFYPDNNGIGFQSGKVTLIEPNKNLKSEFEYEMSFSYSVSKSTFSGKMKTTEYQIIKDELNILESNIESMLPKSEQSITGVISTPSSEELETTYEDGSFVKCEKYEK